MSNMLQLISKHTNEPEKFSTIDDKMCAHFNTPPDAVKYYFNWYNVIGLALSMGLTFDELRNELPEFLAIIDFLDANYTVKAWHSFN